MKHICLYVMLLLFSSSIYAQCKLNYTKVANVSKPVVVDEFLGTSLSTTNTFKWEIAPGDGDASNCMWYEAHPDLFYKEYYRGAADQTVVSGG